MAVVSGSISLRTDEGEVLHTARPQRTPAYTLRSDGCPAVPDHTETTCGSSTTQRAFGQGEADSEHLSALGTSLTMFEGSAYLSAQKGRGGSNLLGGRDSGRGAVMPARQRQTADGHLMAIGEAGRTALGSPVRCCSTAYGRS